MQRFYASRKMSSCDSPASSNASELFSSDDEEESNASSTRVCDSSEDESENSIDSSEDESENNNIDVSDVSNASGETSDKPDSESSEKESSDGETKQEARFSLLDAVARGDADDVSKLLEDGLDLRQRVSLGLDALVTAAEKGRAECLKILLHAGAIVSGEMCDVHHSGCCTDSPLARAVGHVHPECVAVLLQAGANVNFYLDTGCTVVTAATQGHCAKCLHLLLKTKAGAKLADIRYGEDFDRRHAECLQLLLDAGYDIDQRDGIGQNVLLRAAFCGFQDAVRVLIKAGADLNVTDLDHSNEGPRPEDPLNFLRGKTALMHAAARNDVRMVEDLLEAGANVHRATREGIRPLSVAALTGSLECVQTILKADGVDVNARDMNGRTALMSAARENCYPVMHELLRHNSHVNARDSDGRSVLFATMKSDNVRCVALALKFGAHINQMDNSGKSALHYYIDCHYFLLKFRLRLVAQLLYIAGEKLDDFRINRFVFCDYMYEDYVEEEPDVAINPDGDLELLNCLKVTKHLDLSLKHASRLAVRERLIEINPRVHLFDRVRDLEIPLELQDYLLFDKSLDRLSELDNRFEA